jgi:hypothetical protein
MSAFGKLTKSAEFAAASRRVLTLAVMLFPLGPAWGWASGANSQQNSGAAATVPAGTVLYLRLQTPVSTKASKKGQSVAATVAREVPVEGGVAIPLGATLKGHIEKLVQPSKPDDRALLLLSFTGLDIPGAKSFKVAGHVSGVSNARESVLQDGSIQGVPETEIPATLLSGTLSKIAAASPTLGDEIKKQKIGEYNTAIEYSAGTDFQFTLTEALAVSRTFPSAVSHQLPADVSATLESLLAGAPQRAVNKDNRPGDPINLVFIGTAQEIEHAFNQAGWSEPKRETGQSVFGTVRAVMNGEGYGAAPVSDLYVYGRREDLAFEKMLNTFNKRHHLRLWRAPVVAPDGRQIWLGAATHDIGIDIHPGVVSHATDANLDDERAQVDADLIATRDLQAAQLVSPPHPLTSGTTATGGEWHTDGRLLAIDLEPGAFGGTGN